MERLPRRFIGAEHSQEVIFTTGTTLAINLVARSWGDANVGTDDEIIVTEMEHHSNLVPWHQLAQRTGCKIKAWPITDDGRLELEELTTLINDRTKIIAVAAVSNVLGTINPIAEIVDIAHAAGVLVLVDAAQSVPHATTDVRQLGADFLIFSGHKMLGPSGVGVLYGRQELLAFDTLVDWSSASGHLLRDGMLRAATALQRVASGEMPVQGEASTTPEESNGARQRAVQLAVVVLSVAVLMTVTREPVQIGVNIFTAEVGLIAAATGQFLFTIRRLI